MKKKILLILAVLCAVLLALGYWQRNNIAAIRLYLQTPHEDLAAQSENSHKEIADTAKNVSGIELREITDEEKEALKNNTITKEELTEKIVKDSIAPPPKPTPEAKPEPEQKPAPKPEPKPEKKPELSDEEKDRALLASYIAELTVLQLEYTNWLDQANQAAIDEFNALPPEKRTTTAKYEIGFRYMDLAEQKEKECDKKVLAIEKKIRTVLKRLNEDIELLNEIHATYLNEKAVKKAYYLGLH